MTTPHDKALEITAWAFRNNGDDLWRLAWVEPEICYEKVRLSSFPITGKGDDGWMPIAEADSDIAYVHDFGETMRIGNSYPIWARDADGRVFECLWADDGKKSYWWDIEGESPVDPVEFMPHPFDPRFRAPLPRSEEGSDKL
ncbi:hypothetical protein [Rhizobium rhizogenes]|uniref:hypothetical protein n=1 Tax=Rhizobium rhizogenes TaxID=359 RepID=UPI0015743371|nr:hypothetical protein [Rhizobium rhizogenes]NTG07180.1 hypothetical protein [Rhizobium rhizogenes]